MSYSISVNVNGISHQDSVDSRVLLVDYIREKLSLTGTHVGCDTSSCGACTIQIDGKAVKSCTMFAVQADGADITTIEGMCTNGELHPLQEGFKEEHGPVPLHPLQCTYLQQSPWPQDLPHEKTPHPSEAEIRHGLEGNFCRCTGYHNIVKAVQYAANKG